MKLDKEVTLLTEIRDELRKTNNRIEILENYIKEEIAKDGVNEQKYLQSNKPDWKRYIELILIFLGAFALIYYGKQG